MVGHRPRLWIIDDDKSELSYKYMSRKFKEKTGKGFSALQIESKVASAKSLLNNTNLTITQISKELGYSYPSAFMRVFKQKTGLSAGVYRKKVRSSD